MNWRRTLGIFWPVAILTAAPLHFAPAAEASFVVDQWRLTCGVQNTGTGETTNAIFRTVQSPFVNQHQAMVGNGSASASYNISFNSEVVDFNVVPSVVGPGIPAGTGIFTSGCNSILWITNGATPLLVSIDARFTWQIPGGQRDGYMTIAVGDFNQSAGSSPDAGGPPSGSVPLGGTFLLPPNGTYIFYYEIFVDAFSGSPSQLAHGDGYVHIHFETVPETNALAMMIVAGFLFHWRVLPLRRSIG